MTKAPCDFNAIGRHCLSLVVVVVVIVVAVVVVLSTDQPPSPVSFSARSMVSPYSVAPTVMTPPGGMLPRYTPTATTPVSNYGVSGWIHHPGQYIMQQPVSTAYKAFESLKIKSNSKVIKNH